MPSFPDLDDDVQVVGAPPAGPVAPADVLARVKAEGLRRRSRRHRRNGVLAALGIALLAVPAVALLPEDGDDDVTVAAEGDGGGDAAPRTTAAPRATTTVTTATTATTVPPTTVVVEGGDVGLVPPLVIEREAPVTTVPAPACRNSTDPACGEFRWDPAPAANDPLEVTVHASNLNPAVGEEVVFTVTWRDPDSATVLFDHFSPEGAHIASSCSIGRRHGPWDPPAEVAGSGTFTYRHTFTEADAGQVRTMAFSLATDYCDSPYGSEAHPDLAITVQPAA